ncbi:hypothetical protein PG988_013561 [Apiospora saccharicola]
MDTMMRKADARYSDMAPLAGALGEHSQHVQRAAANVQQRQRLDGSIETENAHHIDQLTRFVKEKDALLEEKKAELVNVYMQVEELKRVNDDLLQRLQSQASNGSGVPTPGPSKPSSSAPQSTAAAAAAAAAAAGASRPRKRRRVANAGTVPVDGDGFQWNALMNNLNFQVDRLRPLDIAALETTQAHIFQAVVATLARPEAQRNLSRYFRVQHAPIWYCFEQLAARGPTFWSAMVQEPKDGGLPKCKAHPDGPCLQMRRTTEPELRKGGGTIVWRGD